MSTPPPTPPSVTATPHSKGSASHRTHDVQHSRKDYASYLLEDLTHEKKISVDQFFQWILHIQNPADTSAYDALRAHDVQQVQPRLDALLADYDCGSFRDETQLYRPFVELANYCIEQHDGIIFCRDDPTIVHGSDAQRKPDVVNVRESALKFGDRSSVDNLSKEGPRLEGAFHWMELLGFWEFKLRSVTPESSRTAKKPARPPAQPRTTSRPSPVVSESDRILRPRPATSSGSAGDTRATKKRPSEKQASNPTPKKQKVEEYTDPYTQCASYALELLTYGGLRTHVIGALITNNEIELLFYDRSSIVKSEPFDCKENPARFVTMLHGIARLGNPQWGYHPLVPAPNITKVLDSGVLLRPFGGSVIRLDNERRLITLGQTLFQSHGIIGRGTYVCQATMDSKPVVVKWSWPATTRTPEDEIVGKALASATERGNTWIRSHLPTIIYSETREFDHCSPQHQIATHFGRNEYESRALRIVVQAPLHPITELTTAADLLEAFRGIFKCYRWLYENPEIMHRDISLNNLMYRRVDGKVYGVLNDFDLSVIMGDTNLSTSKQRTGTEPYMARDLLVLGPPPLHLPRFDLESLFYVMVIVTQHYHEGREVANPRYKVWELLGTEDLKKEKQSFFSAGLQPPQPGFLDLHLMIVSLFLLIRDGYNDRSTAQMLGQDFVHETLGGKVTFDTFAAVLFPENLPP